MRDFEVIIRHITEYGLVDIKVKAKPVPPLNAIITFWDRDFEIGKIGCQIGDINAFKAFDIILDGYFKSEEFKSNRKKVVTWN
jgi:hypothetical protein